MKYLVLFLVDGTPWVQTGVGYGSDREASNAYAKVAPYLVGKLRQEIPGLIYTRELLESEYGKELR